MTYTSNAVGTQGYTLAVSTDGASPASYTEVKEIKNFSGFDGQASEIDITHLQSAAKERRMGIQDWGTYQLDTNYLQTDPGQIILRAAKASRNAIYFKATLSDGRIQTFTGFVLSMSLSGGVDAVVEASYSITITGDVTFS